MCHLRIGTSLTPHLLPRAREQPQPPEQPRDWTGRRLQRTAAGRRKCSADRNPRRVARDSSSLRRAPADPSYRSYGQPFIAHSPYRDRPRSRRSKAVPPVDSPPKSTLRWSTSHKRRDRFPARRSRYRAGHFAAAGILGFIQLEAKRRDLEQRHLKHVEGRGLIERHVI